MRDRKDGAVFYTNRVLKDFKQLVSLILQLVWKSFNGNVEVRLFTIKYRFSFFRDPLHTEWAHSFIGALIELQQYCKEFHPMGVTWAS